MPLSFQGSDDNALALVVSERGIVVTIPVGNTRIAIDAVAAAAGVTLTTAGNDRNAIDELYDATAIALPDGYALDDDGTLATAFSYGYAGPAVGVDQLSMQFTAPASGEFILAPASLLDAARFPLLGGTAVCEAVITAISGGNGALVFAVISDEGAVTNIATVSGNEAGQVLAVTIGPDGTVTPYRNGVLHEFSFTAAGSPVVGATDRYGFALHVDASASAQEFEMTLRIEATNITGSYGAGVTDPWGTEI